LPAAGLADRAGRLAAALPHVRDYAARFDLVVHYGAYELVGTSLSLLKAVEAAGVRVVFLAPFHPSSPAFAYARRFWPEMLRAEPETLADPGSSTGLFASRIPLLYDETAPPAPSPEAEGPQRPEERALELFHAQGAEAELREVALRVLRAHRDLGIP